LSKKPRRAEPYALLQNAEKEFQTLVRLNDEGFHEAGTALYAWSALRRRKTLKGGYLRNAFASPVAAFLASCSSEGELLIFNEKYKTQIKSTLLWRSAINFTPRYVFSLGEHFDRCVEAVRLGNPFAVERKVLLEPDRREAVEKAFLEGGARCFGFDFIRSFASLSSDKATLNRAVVRLNLEAACLVTLYDLGCKDSTASPNWSAMDESVLQKPLVYALAFRNCQVRDGKEDATLNKLKRLVDERTAEIERRRLEEEAKRRAEFWHKTLEIIGWVLLVIAILWVVGVIVYVMFQVVLWVMYHIVLVFCVAILIVGLFFAWLAARYS